MNQRNAQTECTVFMIQQDKFFLERRERKEDKKKWRRGIGGYNKNREKLDVIPSRRRERERNFK